MSDTQQLFKTDEFAKLCGVNKKTLIYYHSIGLFEPHFIDVNGYRYYSYHQYDIFSVILALKDLNMPLSEIKEFLNHRTPQLLIETLQSQQIILQERIQKLLHTSQVIDTIIKITQVSQTINTTICFLESQPEAYLTLSHPIKTYDTKPFLNIVSEHIQYCNTHSLDDGYPIGGLVSKEAILAKDFTSISYIFTQTHDYYQSQFSHIKPAGIYAIAYHEGDYSTTTSTYERLLDFISSSGYSITGNSYEETLLDNLSHPLPENYLTKISVSVAPNTLPHSNEG